MHEDVMTEPNFENRTIFVGDNLDVMRGMNSGCIDLVYLDPPFNSNRNYSADASGAAFQDTWHWDDVDAARLDEIADSHPAVASAIRAAGHAHGRSMKSYLLMMALRLIELHRVLKSTGSIWLHCDPTANSYLRMLMDAIFGCKNMRNEVVWCYSTGGASKTRFSAKSTIRFFAMESADEPRSIRNAFRILPR